MIIIDLFIIITIIIEAPQAEDACRARRLGARADPGADGLAEAGRRAAPKHDMTYYILRYANNNNHNNNDNNNDTQ